MKWHSEADVVVIGAGATGLPAAIAARRRAVSVILVEAQPHMGGQRDHQRRQCAARRRHQCAEKVRHRGFAGSGVPGSDRLVGRAAQHGFPDYRYNDREIVRAFADNNVATYDWLLAHAASRFADKAPDERGGILGRQFVPREMHARAARLAAGANRCARGPVRAIRKTYPSGPD